MHEFRAEFNRNGGERVVNRMNASSDAVAGLEQYNDQACLFEKRRERQACNSRANDRDVDCSFRHALWTRNP